MANNKRIFICVVVITLGLWGTLQLFRISSPNTDEIYKMVSRLYGRSLEDINGIIKKTGIAARQPEGLYRWELQDRYGNVSMIQCFFEEESCVFSGYFEFYDDKALSSNRYDDFLRDLTEKFGHFVRDEQEFPAWFRGERKIGVAQILFRELGKTSVLIAVQKKGFLYPSKQK